MSDQTFAFSLRFSRTQFCLAFFSGVFNSLPVGKVLSEARRRDQTIKKSLTFLDEKKNPTKSEPFNPIWVIGCSILG